MKQYIIRIEYYDNFGATADNHIVDEETLNSLIADWEADRDEIMDMVEEVTE